MAYQPQGFDPVKLQKLESRAVELEDSLSSSPTARASGTIPSVDDLANEASAKTIGKEIDVMRGKKLAERWYGKNRDEETFKGEGSQQSGLMRAINALSVPLYATAGAVEGALGKGSKKGILDNITANVKEREGFGNILRRSGMNKYVSMPIGFALDVAFDPLNWATAGTTALIPRIAAGLAKGGAKGAATGAVSRLAPMALKTANVLSAGGITRAQNTAARVARTTGTVPGKFDKAMAAIGTATKAMGKAGSDAATQYDEILGRGMSTSKSGVKYGKDILREKGAGYYLGDERFSLGAGVEELIRSKIPGGDNLVHTFKYSPGNWLRLKRIESEMIENADEIKNKTGFSFVPRKVGSDIPTAKENPELWEQKIGQQMDDLTDQPVKDPVGSLYDETGDNGEVAAMLNDGVNIAENVPTYAQAEDSADILRKLKGEAFNDVTAEDIIGIANKWEQSKLANVTGVKWYDEMNQHLRTNFKIKNTQVVAKMMDAYSAYISLFKLAKIGLTPAAHMNAILGNTTMNAMSGLNIANPKLISSIAGVANAYRQSGPAKETMLKKFFNLPHWLEYAKRDKLGFGGSFAFSLDDLAKRDETFDLAYAKLIKDANKPGGLGAEFAAKMSTKEVKEQLYKELSAVVPAKPGHVEQVSYTLNEINDVKNPVTEWTSKLADKVAKEKQRLTRIKNGASLPGDEIPIAGFGTKAADILTNKSMDAFGAIDPTFRIGTALHLTENGITEAEMNVLSRMMGMTKDDILDVVTDPTSGEKLFKLTPDKATEVVGEIFLNYSAMPAAVKMLRTLPILGAPFASFTYGMTSRVGKTAMYNPALYNKTNFMLQEIAGDKDPLEKKAMDSKYYSWFKDPGMVKLPFVEKFPLYANVTNMLPYYSMNMFTPSERKYGETLPDSVMSFLDKFPVLQDPAGQVMFDYFIQPLLLSKGQSPQGSFGQALYPLDSTGLDKVGYATRQLAESVVPGVAGLAALGTAPFTSGEHINYMPSYRYRQLANAIKGRTALGIPSKEPASSRTARTLGSMFGLPTHRMDTSFTEQEVKKDIKKAK